MFLCCLYDRNPVLSGSRALVKQPNLIAVNRNPGSQRDALQVRVPGEACRSQEGRGMKVSYCGELK